MLAFWCKRPSDTWGFKSLGIQAPEFDGACGRGNAAACERPSIPGGECGHDQRVEIGRHARVLASPLGRALDGTAGNAAILACMTVRPRDP